MKSKGTFYKLLLSGALSALIAVPAVNAQADHEPSHQAESVAEITEAKSVTGTVKEYYTDLSGHVTIVEVETGNESQRLNFVPSWGKRMLEKYPTGSTLNAWVDEDNNIRGLGEERPNRLLQSAFHTGAQRLDSRAWVWNDGKRNQTVSGKLKRVLVNKNGEALALVLDDDTLVRIHREVRHNQTENVGNDAIAQLFKGADVTAWGPQEWDANGDVSIYGRRIASNGLSINGKNVSAIGILRFSSDATTPDSETLDASQIQEVPDYVVSEDDNNVTAYRDHWKAGSQAYRMRKHEKEEVKEDSVEGVEVKKDDN